MLDLLDLFVTLGEKPTRWNWVNWIVWGLAILMIVLFAVTYLLIGINYVTGWPPL